MIMFKVIKAVVGFFLGIALSIALMVFLCVGVYKLTRPQEDYHDTITYMLRDYERCENEPEGTLLACPVCNRNYYKDWDLVCCSETCEDEYLLLKAAWNRGDEKLVEKHGKIFK